MKTPDEIKKGIYICYVQPDGRTCGICPYDVISEGYCECNLWADALEYIQQLEKERSALLADLREADMVDCAHCAHYIPVGVQCEGEGDCLECDLKNCVCNECLDNSNWKWRGVLEVEDVREF